MGYHNPLFDILDERRLGLHEIRDFLINLFGAEQFKRIPNPRVNWKGFLKRLSIIVNQEKEQWNPVTKRLGPWVDIEILEKEFKKAGQCAQS